MLILMTVMLQWGRAHRSAETLSTQSFLTARPKLQWGRAHRSAETGQAFGRCSQIPRCFNGAALTEARKHIELELLEAHEDASMGPRSQKRGNIEGWAHDIFATARFNGAALTEARKRSPRKKPLI